jgi:hypothetical protein
VLGVTGDNDAAKQASRAWMQTRAATAVLKHVASGKSPETITFAEACRVSSAGYGALGLKPWIISAFRLGLEAVDHQCISAGGLSRGSIDGMRAEGESEERKVIDRATKRVRRRRRATEKKKIKRGEGAHAHMFAHMYGCTHRYDAAKAQRKKNHTHEPFSFRTFMVPSPPLGRDNQQGCRVGQGASQCPRGGNTENAPEGGWRVRQENCSARAVVDHACHRHKKSPHMCPFINVPSAVNPYFTTTLYSKHT